MKEWYFYDASGTRRRVKQPYFYDAGGTRRTVKAGYFYDSGGVRRQFYSTNPFQVMNFKLTAGVDPNDSTIMGFQRGQYGSTVPVDPSAMGQGYLQGISTTDFPGNQAINCGYRNVLADGTWPRRLQIWNDGATILLEDNEGLFAWIPGANEIVWSGSNTSFKFTPGTTYEIKFAPL